jgi:hypothetical protein
VGRLEGKVNRQGWEAGWRCKEGGLVGREEGLGGSDVVVVSRKEGWDAGMQGGKIGRQ